MASAKSSNEHRLTNQNFWESFHTQDGIVPEPACKRGRLPEWLTRDTGVEREWGLVQRYLGAVEGLSAIEIGCAPAEVLMEWKHRMGVVPYGVEYTESGVVASRRAFRAAGVNAGNLMQADFFNATWQAEHRDSYDVVISRGFLEHFENPRAVVEAHLNILRPGGVLVLSIPQLRGLHYWITRVFAPEVLPSHNLAIMSLPVFRSLFPESVCPMFCGYSGGLNLMIADYPNQPTVRRVLLSALRRVDLLLRVAANLMPGTADTPMSANLLFIGTKRA